MAHLKNKALPRINVPSKGATVQSLKVGHPQCDQTATLFLPVFGC